MPRRSEIDENRVRRARVYAFFHQLLLCGESDIERDIAVRMAIAQMTSPPGTLKAVMEALAEERFHRKAALRCQINRDRENALETYRQRSTMEKPYRRSRVSTLASHALVRPQARPVALVRRW